MENDFPSAWDVPRPVVRLWLTLSLGILGALLFPAKQEFFVILFANVRGVTLLAWMTAALAGVLLLHRVEDVKIPKSAYVLMGLALALCLIFPRGATEEKSGELIGFSDALLGLAWFCCVSLLLLAVGVLSSGSRLRREWSWLECLVRGPAIALAAPLLLFASRRTGDGGSSLRLRALSRMAFAVFLLAPVASFALLTILGKCGYRDLASRLGLFCISSCVWTWLGCALLFLLSPWPEYPSTSQPGDPPRARWVGHFGTAVILVMALLALLVWLQEVGFPRLLPGIIYLARVHPLLWVWIGCALLFLLSPWPEYPPIPKLGNLPEERKASPLGMIFFLALALVPLASFAFGPFLYVASGQLFASTFDRVHVGGAMDQPSLTKWFFLFTYFSALVLPYVAVARWMSDRSTRFGYWAFTVLTIALCLCPLSILTLPFWWVIQYIDAMGITPRRVYGLVYALGGYIAVLGFLCWAVWPPKESEIPVENAGVGSP